LERSYIYAGAQPIAFYEGDYTDPAYIYLHDRLGSVRQVLDESGNVKNTYTYTPFGQDPNDQFAETVDNPFKFTGQWYDSEIGQYHLRARMYDPQLMRLTAIDPVSGKQNQPLTLHKYLYCTNDPINLTDPSGKYAGLVIKKVVYQALFVTLTMAWHLMQWVVVARVGGIGCQNGHFQPNEQNRGSCNMPKTKHF
jgi:RHS repeat-associated protein